jgi:hypothetical protein
MRRIWAPGGTARQVMILVVLIVFAFGAAVYLGIRNPYHPPPVPPAQTLRITLIPLTPGTAVPAADPKDPFAGRVAQDYRSGADGINLPPAQRIASFSESQVMQALSTAKEYLVASSMNPDGLTGGDIRAVRNLLAPGQLDQFDRSLERPADDGLHAATGWLVRFDPARVKLAGSEVRVRGAMQVSEVATDVLEVTTDHTLVYAVRSATEAAGAPSLFTVRRELRLRFDQNDLLNHQTEPVQASVQAGPLACGAPIAYFRPLLAGQTPQAVAGVDPHDRYHAVTSVCGMLAPEASVSALPGGPAASPAVRPVGPASASASPARL